MSNAIGRSDLIFKRANHTGWDSFGSSSVKIGFLVMRLRTLSHYKESACELKTRLNCSGAELHHQCHRHLGLSQAIQPFICMFWFISFWLGCWLSLLGRPVLAQKLSINTFSWCPTFQHSASHRWRESCAIQLNAMFEGFTLCYRWLKHVSEMYFFFSNNNKNIYIYFL